MAGQRQLTLDLPHEPSRARDDFVVTPANCAAFALIEAWPDWPSRALYLIGPAGSGKTHLSAIWRGRAGAVAVDAARPDDLARDAHGALLIEDLDRVAFSERGLFHLLNLAAERDLHMLFTSRAPLRAIPIDLPDLASRLSAVPSIALQPPDDMLLAAVLAKQFADRQIAVDPEVVAYLVARMERSLGEVGRIVERLDRISLAEGRRVTKALARGVIGLGREIEE